MQMLTREQIDILKQTSALDPAVEIKRSIERTAKRSIEKSRRETLALKSKSVAPQKLSLSFSKESIQTSGEAPASSSNEV